MRLFHEKELTWDGRYNIDLYDCRRGVDKWVTITIDDFVPCRREDYERYGEVVPAFSSVTQSGDHHQIWILLLEKAVAKLLGSYAELEGGKVTWALRALTGDEVFVFENLDAAVLPAQ